MVDSDRRIRFMAVLKWLCRKYQVNGVDRKVPTGRDLEEYFTALGDIPIDDIEGGARWHYGHSEFYPTLPGALRKSAEEWRRANPRPYQPPGQRVVEIVEATPESRERGTMELQRVLDALGRGENPLVITVSDLVGEV